MIELYPQDPLYLSTHLLTHGLSLTSYTDLHMSQEVEAEIVSTVSSTSKSSPCLGENVRKSMDNISEGSNSSHLQETETTKNKIKGVELIEPDEVSNEGDDEDSSYEEMLHMPEPHIEIQENDVDEVPNINEDDVEVNIIESPIDPSRHLMETTLRYLGGRDPVSLSQFMSAPGHVSSNNLAPMGDMFR